MQTASRRRWYQVSLRSLLLLITVAGVGLGWVGSERKQSQYEMQIAEQLTASGANVDIAGRFDNADPFVQPTWWRNILSKLCGPRVRQVSVDGHRLSDLSSIAGLKSIKGLALHFTQVSDLAPLSELTSLERITIDGSPVGDIEPLARLKNLTGLDLNMANVSDLSPLSSLDNLELLRVQATQVRDVSPLVGLTRLRYINIVGTLVSDEQVQILQKALPNCKIER